MIPRHQAAPTLERMRGLAGARTPQDTDAGVPEGSGRPSVWLGCPEGLGRGGPGEGGTLGDVEGSDAPGLHQGARRARRWGPQAPRAAPATGGPGPLGLKQIPSSRPRAHAHPESPGPARLPAPPRLGPYLSVSGPPAPARHCAALPLRGSSMALAGCTQARPDPTNRASDSPAPGQPSAESSRRRRRPPPPEFAGAGAQWGERPV